VRRIRKLALLTVSVLKGRPEPSSGPPPNITGAPDPDRRLGDIALEAGVSPERSGEASLNAGLAGCREPGLRVPHASPDTHHHPPFAIITGM
jgi:hypothetical protein